jgi:ABC-type branched-subunit amino acid transport system permease subunit
MRAILQHRLASIPAMTAIVFVLPLFFPSGYYYRVAALVFVFALAATGLNLLMGLAGQVSLGHAGFMGIGAYAVAIAPTHLGLPSWLSLILGAARLVVLPQTLTFLHDYEHMVLGLIVMAVMIFLRAGIVPTLTNALAARRA